MKIRHIHLEETTSTNIYIKGVALAADEMVVVSTDWQTAGRGQGINRWESERGKNLLFSLMARPSFVDVQQQFALSMAGALAIKDVSLAQITGKHVALMPLLDNIVEAFIAQWNLLKAGNTHLVAARYNAALYRATGFHRYSDKQGAFDAELVGVETNGLITLRDRQGQLRTYSQPYAANGEMANKLRFEI